MSFSVPGGQAGELSAQSRHDPPPERGPERPAAFAVRASWTNSGSDATTQKGRGELLISPGAITFSPSLETIKRTGASDLAHTEGAIRVTRTAVPPSTIVVLRNSQVGEIRLRASGFAHDKMLHALQDCGATVEQ